MFGKEGVMSTVNRKLLLLIAALLALAGSMRAQQADPAQFPTVTALEEAVVPARDRAALAQRFLGVGEIPPPPTAAPVRQVGEQETFLAVNSAEDRVFEVTATLRVVGDHIYLWVENGAPLSDGDLQALADAFDQEIYPSVRAMWGSEAIPGIDGDPRVYGLFAYGLGPGTGAYFLSEHTYPREVVSTSNEHEMFFFNLDAIPHDAIASPGMQGIVAHEFQHMIRANLETNEDIWLNEGFSEFTQLYLGYDPFGQALSFLIAPYTQLNTWSEDGPRAPHYGAAMLFVAYLYERYGLEAIQALSNDMAKGMASFDNVLRAFGHPGVDVFFAEWVMANWFLDPRLGDGRYGYRLLMQGLSSPAPVATPGSYPFLWAGQTNQYATDYFLLGDLDSVESLAISLEIQDTVQLVPITPESGRWMWYSNKGDFSDTTLTRAFDLSGVDSATLNYRAWYHIEHLWDFGYVMVSEDGGETWDILATPHTTSENPHNTGYGPGYTGQSGGWIDESLSLDEYVGSDILVRFEVITDDAVTQPGLVIDDVSIPEIGYMGDFETGDDGWTAEGWIRTDNLLPQRAWLQVAQRVGNEVLATRWLAPAESHWTLPLNDGASQVVVAVSPFAPVTTVPAMYTLNIGVG
jgi:hypothetical protein